MHIDQFNIDPGTLRLVSRDTLADIVSGFHPVGECRLCGSYLGEHGRFSLLVDDADDIVTVRPVHAPCMSSTTRRSNVIVSTPAVYETLVMVIPLTVGNRKFLQPTIILNPSTAQAILMRELGRDGEPLTLRSPDYQSMTRHGWHHAGDQTPGAMGIPVGQAVTDDGRALRLESAEGTWSVDLDADDEVETIFMQRARELGGCFVAVVRRTWVREVLDSPQPLRGIAMLVADGDWWTGFFPFDGRSHADIS